MTVITGIEKARAVADKLRKEQAVMVENEVKELQAVKNSLAVPESLKEMYEENVGVGMEGAGAGKLPLLKIKQEGKGKFTLADGKTKPNDGFYFYTPTQEQFESIKCHILLVTKSYYQKPMEGMADSKKKFTQLLAGVIVDGEQYKPFVMFISGKKLSPMWKFMGEEMNKYTHKIPMFSMLVEMGATQVETKFDPTFVPTFKLVKDEAENPVLVADEGLFVLLRDNVDILTEFTNNIIENNELEETEDPSVITANAQAVKEAEEVFGTQAK